jgi:DNA replication protein DnaC
MERYDLYINAGYKTHLSSNLVTNITNNIKKIPTLRMVYGARAFDRMIEMTNVIIFKGESQRK